MEGLADLGEQLTLGVDEVELGIDVTVGTLASLTTNGDDGSICPTYLLINSDSLEAYLGIFLLTKLLLLEPVGGMALCLELQAGKVVVFAIDVGEGLRGADASIFQSLHQVDDIGCVHAT